MLLSTNGQIWELLDQCLLAMCLQGRTNERQDENASSEILHAMQEKLLGLTVQNVGYLSSEFLRHFLVLRYCSASQ